MKRAATFVITLLMLTAFFPLAASAVSAQIPLYVNGTEQSVHQYPKMIGNAPFLDVETLADILDGEAELSPGKDAAQIRSEEFLIAVNSSSSVASVNGLSYELGAKPLRADGTLYVPVRNIGKQLGIKYIWDKLTQSLFLYVRSGGAGNAMPNLDELSDEQKQVLIPPPEPTNEAAAGVQLHIAGSQVVIQTGQAVNPRNFILRDQVPYRIVLDYPASVFGHGPNSDPAHFRGEVTADGALVKKVRYGLNDPTTLRIVIELARDVEYSVASSADGMQTIVSMKEKAQPTYVVVIDAGHGGKDPGAEGASGRFEKWFTLDQSKKIYELLAKEPLIKPYMTRDDDTFISREDRAAFANDLKADLFISIHGNTFEQAVSGTETFYFSQQDKAFADVIHEHLVKATGFRDRGVKQERFVVLRETSMPAVLLELGYLTTKNDEAKMLTDEFQDAVAAAVAAAVKEYLNIP